MEEAVWKSHTILTAPSKGQYCLLKVTKSDIPDKYPDAHKRVFFLPLKTVPGVPFFPELAKKIRTLYVG